MTDHEVYAALGKAIVTAQRDQGFGSPSKRDMELLIFHHLRQLETFREQDNYGLANILKVPESKIKGLRLASALKHTDIDSDVILGGIFQRLTTSIKPRITEDMRLEIALEDPIERRELTHKLKLHGRHPGITLNDEVLVIAPSDLLAILFKDKQSLFDVEMRRVISDNKLQRDALAQCETLSDKAKAVFEKIKEPETIANITLSLATKAIGL